MQVYLDAGQEDVGGAAGRWGKQHEDAGQHKGLDVLSDDVVDHELCSCPPRDWLALSANVNMLQTFIQRPSRVLVPKI